VLWWGFCKHVITAFERMKQKDLEFQGRSGYTVKFCPPPQKKSRDIQFFFLSRINSKHQKACIRDIFSLFLKCGFTLIFLPQAN
jgi:hypothetical protein